jgi:hypothetical protein
MNTIAFDEVVAGPLARYQKRIMMTKRMIILSSTVA